MRFLRSVIADAHPRKPMLEPSNGPSAITGWKTRGLDGDAFGAEEKSPSAPDQTSRLNTSLPIREGASDFNMGDAPAFQADNPVNQGIQDVRSNVESEGSLSVMVDKSRTISDEESHARQDTDNDGNSSLQVGEGTGQLGVQETMSSATEGNTPAQGKVTGRATADDRHHSESSTKGPVSGQAPTPDNSAGRNQDHDSSIASPETRGARNRASGHEKTGPLSPPASIGDMPGKELADNDGNSSLQVGEGAGQLGVQATMSSAAEGNTPAQGKVTGKATADDRHHSESSTKGPVSGQAPTPDNCAGRNEVEKALADGGKARQVSRSVDKQADMKNLSNYEETPRLQKPDEAKGILRDVQLVSRQAMAMDSHISSDMELASVPQSAGRKVSTSASSPGSGSSKPSSAVQHIARPAKPSASPEALRSVTARPFQADLMPKDGDSFHLRPPLRSPEKKHEAPKVQIGQIDVIIEAVAQPATKPAPASSSIDLASRYYLRRL